MTTTIKYLIEDDRIVFFNAGEIRVASSNDFWVFEPLKNALQNGNYAGFEFSPKDYLIEAVEQRKDIFGIKQRLEELESSEMPTEPFLNFISRLNEENIKELAPLISKVGTTEAPLTWDGDVVLYQRAAWLDSNWVDETNFAPGNVVQGTSVVGEFTNIMRQCPDTGNAYEVVVRPENILSQRDSNTLYVSDVMQLSQLGERVKKDQRSESPVVQYVTQCIGEANAVFRVPYSADTAAAYVASLFNTNMQGNIARLNQLVEPEPVLVSVSC